MAELTPKQQRFVGEYLVDLNATQAAIRAGYSGRTAEQQGSRLLSNAKVAVAVAKQQAVVADKLELTREWVLRGLRDNFERAMTAEPARDREGNETGEYTYEGSVANKSLELIGKHLGMFTDKVQLSGPGGGPLSLSLTVVFVRAKA